MKINIMNKIPKVLSYLIIFQICVYQSFFFFNTDMCFLYIVLFFFFNTDMCFLYIVLIKMTSYNIALSESLFTHNICIHIKHDIRVLKSNILKYNNTSRLFKPMSIKLCRQWFPIMLLISAVGGEQQPYKGKRT